MIPDVNYKSQNGDDLGIEYVELSSLYERFPLKDHDPSKPHRVQFNNLVLITNGNGNHFVDFKHYPVKPGDIIYVTPSQIQAFDFEKKPDAKLLIFTPQFIAHLRTGIRLPFLSPHHVDTTHVPVFSMAPALARSCETLIDEIHSALDTRNSSLLIQLLFSALMLKIMDARPTPLARQPDEHRIKTFTTFVHLVEDQFMETREAAAYAKMMCITYKTLNDICKRCSGKTAKQLIDSHTVLEAKRRLAIEGVRIEQLSDDLGFDEATNFVKYFKKHAAITPAQFKKQFAG